MKIFPEMAMRVARKEAKEWSFGSRYIAGETNRWCLKNAFFQWKNVTSSIAVACAYLKRQKSLIDVIFSLSVCSRAGDEVGSVIWMDKNKNRRTHTHLDCWNWKCKRLWFRSNVVVSAKRQSQRPIRRSESDRVQVRGTNSSDFETNHGETTETNREDEGQDELPMVSWTRCRCHAYVFLATWESPSMHWWMLAKLRKAMHF